MAITVPKYSDAGSTNTNLPTRRLTGFSAAGIRQMGAPGMALSSVGKNTFAVAKDFGERAIEENKEESRLWVVNAETEFRTELAAGVLDLQANTVQDDYLNNESFKDGSNPNTYYNKSKNLFDKTLDPLKKDGTPSNRYKPPSDFAAKMWEKSKAKIRAGYNIEAMNYEANVRSKAMLDQLETNLETQQLNAYENPASVDDQLGILDNLDVVDDPKTDKKEGNGILAQHLVGVKTDQAAKIVYSAFEGLIAQDGFAALAALKGKEIKDNPAAMALVKHRKKLTPNMFAQLEAAAKRKAVNILEVDIQKFEETYTTHINSLAAGGPGIEEYNILDLKGGEDKTGLEAAHDALYFGKYEDLKRELLPDLADKADASWKKISSGVRISRTQGMILNEASTLKAGDLLSRIESLRDVSKADPGNIAGIVQKMNLGDDTKKGLLALSLNEQVAVVSGVIQSFVQEVNARNSDFGAWANNTYDAIQYMPTKTPEERLEKLRAVLNLADKLEQPMGANYILPDSAAKSISAQAAAIKTVDGAVSFYDQLAETYGGENDPVFERVWSQLTTMKSGALGPEWQWYGALKNTQAGGLFFKGGKADRTELDNMAKAKGPSFTTSNLETAIGNQFQAFIMAATGAMPERAAMGSWMMETIEKMIIQEAMSNNHSGYGSAVTTVLNGLTDKIGIISTEKANLMILPQHRADSAIIESNLNSFFEGSMNEVAMDLATKTKHGVFLPGSLELPTNVGIEERYNLFMSHIKKHGRFVMAPDGVSAMLVIPQGGISSDSADGYGSLRPVFENKEGGGRGQPILWSIESLAKPEVDMGDPEGNVKVRPKTFVPVPEIKLVKPEPFDFRNNRLKPDDMPILSIDGN